MFEERDPGEIHVGKRVETFTKNDYIPYIFYMAQENGFRYAPERDRDRQVYQGLITTYKKADAGKIVKWMFYRYNGYYEGETFNANWFCRNRKWWTDKMFGEMTVASREKTSDTTGLELLRHAASRQALSL